MYHPTYPEEGEILQEDDNVTYEQEIADTTRQENTAAVLDVDENIGDNVYNKDHNTLRIGFINIHGIPKDRAQTKNKTIYNAIMATQLDIIGMAETNLNWNAVTTRNRWSPRISNWFESSSVSIGFNRKDSVHTTNQTGGTLLTSINKVAHRIDKHGKLARDTIRHAEKNNLVAPEQYGSRNGKRAVEHAVNKRITYDILRQTRLPGAMRSNDAKSCYDRIP